MISVEYVLAEPGFRPHRAVDRSAALDVKAYLPVPPDTFWESLRATVASFSIEYPQSSVYIDGKKITTELSLLMEIVTAPPYTVLQA